ncbi:MAG: hypothetical protein ACR2JI_04875 [Mycobacterium sp.]
MKILLCLLAVALAASAMTTPPRGEADAVPLDASQSPRYHLEVSGSKVFRIDSFTGRMWEMREMQTDRMRFQVMLPVDEEGGAAHNTWHAWARENAVPAQPAKAK